MSTEIDVMALAAQASTILVAEASRSGWQGLRRMVGRFFRRDGQQSLDRQMVLLENAHEQLASPDADVRARARDDLAARWLRQLSAYLERFPEAVDDLRALLADLDALPAPGEATTMTANANHHSIVLQARGDVIAGAGGINFGVPRRLS